MSHEADPEYLIRNSFGEFVKTLTEWQRELWEAIQELPPGRRIIIESDGRGGRNKIVRVEDFHIGDFDRNEHRFLAEVSPFNEAGRNNLGEPIGQVHAIRETEQGLEIDYSLGGMERPQAPADSGD